MLGNDQQTILQVFWKVADWLTSLRVRTEQPALTDRDSLLKALEERWAPSPTSQNHS